MYLLHPNEKIIKKKRNERQDFVFLHTICTRNSVLIRRVLSSSFSERSCKSESTSSINITDG